ncbi:DUF3958 family protein [Staphylococcus edaphicus]|uniref:DUF3958 family protein n=1 Tax=Staphylococcus edaphicus TaxID=1955013 RepID=A0A2C6WLU3_9STAP|nr:DUF3958 family protein [Staphylococcus edaphicus]PHK48726.1 hypothetical protein BTJ66_11855 [Staphylococcus edaphicus]UQW81650.1 DUF3958 family protein [Staphylococcus edaphicus]
MSILDELNLKSLQKSKKIESLYNEIKIINEISEEYYTIKSKSNKLFEKLGERYPNGDISNTLDHTKTTFSIHNQKVINSLSNQKKNIKKEIQNLEEEIEDLKQQKAIEIQSDAEGRNKL